MNLENTLKFINELNDKNIELQEKYNNLEKENKQLQDNLDSLTKVSYLNNINKQLQDKITQNELLSKQLEKAYIIINAFQKIKVRETKVLCVVAPKHLTKSTTGREKKKT